MTKSLKAKIAEIMKVKYSSNPQDYITNWNQAEELINDLTRLLGMAEGALEWYTNEDNWTKIYDDEGNKAKEALTQLKTEMQG